MIFRTFVPNSFDIQAGIGRLAFQRDLQVKTCGNVDFTCTLYACMNIFQG